MTREQAREAAAVMLGFADGKEVQVRSRKWNPRESLKPDWVDEELSCWNFEDFDYRLKPAPVLRPWTADEVPLGAWVRPKKDLYYRSLITSTGTDISRKEWFNNNEHSTDGGLTWKPCGVEEVWK